MRNIFLVIMIAIGLSGITTNAQTNLYEKYIDIAKRDYKAQKYRMALNRFELAFEFAQTNDQKANTRNWQNRIWISIDSVITLNHKKATYTKPEINNFLKEGDICFRIKEFSCAATNYSKILETEENNIKILEKLRKCYSQIGDTKKNYYITLKLMHLDSLNYRHYYNFSFYALFNHDYDGAKKAAKISLILKPNRKLVNSNLAMAYILNNQFSEAKKIYIKYRNKALSPYSNKAKINFLEDIETLEHAGIHHKDFKKAKKLLE